MSRASRFILAFVSFAGCAQLETPVAPRPQEVASIALASTGLSSRLWKGRCEGSGVFSDSITLHITANCNFAQLKRMKVVAIETVVPRGEGFLLNTTSSYTAADGDVLYTTSVGRATLKPDFSGVTFLGIETAVGGTGRFINASGSATRKGSTRFSDLSASYEILGTLTISTDAAR